MLRRLISERAAGQVSAVGDVRRRQPAPRGTLQRVFHAVADTAIVPTLDEEEVASGFCGAEGERR